MPISILIDTNIWHFAYVEPKELQYEEIHQKAKEFLFNKLKEKGIKIFLTSYQVSEILDMLRKGNVSKEIRIHLMELMETPLFSIIDLHFSIVKVSFQKSLNSNIHIYDYLVALPLKGTIGRIYSADDHFQHKDFLAVAPVENPLEPWILREGRKPFEKVHLSQKIIEEGKNI